MKKKLSMLGLTEETATLGEMEDRVRESMGLDWNTVTKKERENIEWEAQRILSHLRMVKKENDKTSWFTKMFLSKGEVDSSGNPIDDDKVGEELKKTDDALRKQQSIADMIGGLIGLSVLIFFLMWLMTIIFDFPYYFNSLLSVINNNDDILIISSVILIALLALGSIFYFAGSVLAIIIVFLIPFFLFIFISGISDLEKIQYILVIGTIVISGLLYKILDKLK